METTFSPIFGFLNKKKIVRFFFSLYSNLETRLYQVFLKKAYRENPNTGHPESGLIEGQFAMQKQNILVRFLNGKTCFQCQPCV